MTAKLIQVNYWIERIINEIDDDTILFVIGDHGMDSKGNHGGDGYLETETTTFVYSKKIIENTVLNNLISRKLNLDTSDFKTTNQIDFVPTFALLTGVSIPFSNLGSIIPELFPDNIVDAISTNSIQVHTFLKQYCYNGCDLDFKRLDDMFFDLRIGKDDLNGDEQVSDFVVANMKFMKTVLHDAKLIWARFNDILIWMGVFGLGIGLASNIFGGYIGIYDLLISITIGSCGFLLGGILEGVSGFQISIFSTSSLVSLISLFRGGIST